MKERSGSQRTVDVCTYIVKPLLYETYEGDTMAIHRRRQLYIETSK